MTRYVWAGPGKVVVKKARRSARGVLMILDIAPFRSPIDGSEISSRKALRDHERRHGVRQVGNDWAGDSDQTPPPPWWENRKRT